MGATILRLPRRGVVPAPATVLERLGLPADVSARRRHESAVEAACEELAALVEPVGLFADMSSDGFGAVYQGEGQNVLDAPLAEIYRRADVLSLFAVTIGRAVSTRIAELFETHEFALGSMLDAAASEATELAADGLEQHVLDELTRLGAATPSTSLVRYSPGYCGWHLSGQRALFAALRPEAIGLTLRDSCLMEPLKSISGVMVLGRADIHEFSPTYSCCAECRTSTCLTRMRGLEPARR
jgi:hypothetical protein